MSQSKNLHAIQADALQEDQKRLLELMALDAPLNDILDVLLHMIEARSVSGLIGSILLVDKNNTHLRFGAAPSLPAEYSQAIDGIPIGHGVGSCGTAAFLKKTVAVPDIANDPLWKDFRLLAAKHSLRACWSTPIFASDGEILGTFAMYYTKPHAPDENDLKLVEVITRTAAIAIERNRIKEALHTGQQRYKLISRATNDIIWDWNLATNAITWNDATYLQLGYTCEELGSDSEDHYQRIHPDDRDRIIDGINTALNSGLATWSDEYRFCKKDNSYALFMDRGFIARDESGHAYRMVGSMLNLTERKQANEALLESQNRFRTIVDQTISGVVQADADGCMTLVNQCWCEMLGYSETDLLQMTLLDVTHEDSRVAALQALTDLADGGKNLMIDARYKRKDGTFFWASSNINALRNDTGEYRGLVAVILDITERKHAEEALWLSEANSQNILQSITDGFIAIDDNWNFTYVNKAAENILDRTASNLIGKNLWTEYPKVIGTDFERHYRHASLTREPLNFTSHYADHDRWYEINVYPSAQGICVYFRNITENREVQDQLRARHARSRLIASISAWLVLRTANAEAESVDQLLESVFLNIAQHLNAEYYFNFAAIEGSQDLRLISSSGLNTQKREALAQIRVGEYLCGKVALTRQPLVLNELQNCTSENVSALTALGAKAYAGFPLLAHGNLLGTVSFATALRTSFNDEELELIQTVVDLLAVAVQRERSTAALQKSEQKYRSLFESIDDGFCTVEVLYDDDNKPVDYRYLETNVPFELQTGMANAVGKTIKELAPGIEESWIETVALVAQTGKAIRSENYAAPLNRWFDCYIFCIDQPQGDIVGIIFSDTTERKRRELNLALLTEVQQDLALPIDTDAILQIVGEKICRHFGFSIFAFSDIDETAELASSVYVTATSAIENTSTAYQLRDFFSAAHLAKLKKGQVVAIDNIRNAAIPNNGGAYIEYEARSIINAPYLSEGALKFLVSGAHREPYHWRNDEVELLGELTARTYLHLERARTEIRVRESESRYRALIDASSQVIYRMSADLKDLAILKDGGFIESNTDIRSNWLQKYIHPEDHQLVMNTWRAARHNKTAFELEHRVRRADGSWGWIFSRAIPLHDSNGNVLEWFGTATDINDRKHYEDTLWQGANFDSLTGLPNRRLFRDRLEQEIKKAHRSGLAIALFFIDLDRFKQVNDLHGHAIGDELLIEASKRINTCVREFDTVARLGGDEFTAILSDLENKNDSEHVAKKILDTLAMPFKLGRQTVHLSSSVGITYFPDDAANAEDLIRNADQAMYSAKYAGRNQYKHFVKRMQHEALDRLRLIEDLRDAVRNSQFEVHYQPVIDLASGRIVKAEALLRWQHPHQGQIDPSVFIPFAEDSGLINEIGDWVFTEAATCSKICQAHTGKSFQISVNKSPLQFNDGAKGFDWIAYLEAQHLPASSISIEITEGLLLNTSKETRSKLLLLRNAGIEVAIDDFGTGYSSMAYLKEFEIDYLKIDQSFINNMASNKADFAIVRSIIAMAHELEIRVIAEGIETSKQHELLINAGCDFGQGYLFSEAVTGSRLVSLLQQDAIRLH